MRKVISNTTPIITLLTISKLELLHQIYGQIIIPNSTLLKLNTTNSKPQ